MRGSITRQVRNVLHRKRGNHRAVKNLETNDHSHAGTTSWLCLMTTIVSGD